MQADFSAMRRENIFCPRASLCVDSEAELVLDWFHRGIRALLPKAERQLSCQRVYHTAHGRRNGMTILRRFVSLKP